MFTTKFTKYHSEWDNFCNQKGFVDPSNLLSVGCPLISGYSENKQVVLQTGVEAKWDVKNKTDPGFKTTI